MKYVFKILIFFSFAAKSQNANLLPDPGFEDTIICSYMNPFANLKYWYNPTDNTPDALHICTDNVVNLTDEIKRHSGYGRAMIYLYATQGPPFEQREYVASPLTTTLTANKKYCVDFYTMPVKESKYGCNSLGVYFGAGHQYFNTYVIPQVTPQSDTLLPVAISDTSKWFHYMDIYTATGNETDMIVGNFRPDALINVPIIDSFGGIWNGAYYVFDDISLHEMSINSGTDAVTCPQNMVATIGETNTDTAFKNYYWYDASGILFDSINSQIQVSPTSNTFYVQEKRMCGQSFFDTVYVNIDTVCPLPPPEPPVEETALIIPNVFSPNGDGINDVWKVNIESRELQKFTIYNRWGVEQANSKDLNLKQTKVLIWDGHTTSGINCSEGIYYYIIEFKNSKGETEKHKGYIQIIRN